MSIDSVKIDSYISGLLGPRYDMALYERLLVSARDAGLPPISISASQGQLLHVLVRATGAKRILEIGTLGGYSGTWLASAMPTGGRLISLELDAHHAEVAVANFAMAGLADTTEVIVGPAVSSMDKLIADGVEPFDLIFIDADKPGYVTYLERALKLIRKGGLILGDNALSHGVLDGDKDSGITKFNAAVAAAPTLTSALVPVMKHDLDGFTISVAG